MIRFCGLVFLTVLSIALLVGASYFPFTNFAGGADGEEDGAYTSYRDVFPVDVHGVRLPPAFPSERAALDADLRSRALGPDSIPATASRPYIPGPEHLPPDVWGKIRRAARATGTRERLLGKLCMSESSGRVIFIAGPNRDGSYDFGPFGWNSRWLVWHWERYGIFDPFRVEEAATAAAFKLHDDYRILGNWEDSVASYKAGLSRVLAGREGWEVRAIAREVVR